VTGLEDAGLQEAAEETGRAEKDLSKETLATPTAAVAIAAFLIKFLLFADSIVDSGHTSSLLSDLLPVSSVGIFSMQSEKQLL
jgi:hypothetical protein